MEQCIYGFFREPLLLPLRRMNGKKRGFFAYRDELLEWSKRNAV